MANRKLKNFEYANHSEKGSSKNRNTDELTYFESINGSVFLLCQDSSAHDLEVSPAALATQRLKYYLENEFVEKPSAALRNALIYTNGFIYEYGRKNPEYLNAYVNCACILIRDNKVFYTSLGELSLYYFNGKRPVLISKGDIGNFEDTQEAEGDLQNPDTVPLLGKYKEIDPVVNREPLVPVNEDMLLMCSKGFYENLTEKSIQKILTDPMPVQTKVYRFVDMASIASDDENISLQLISFYNLDHVERKFVPLVVKKSKVVKKKAPDKENSPPDSDKTSVLNEYRERLKDSPVRYILVGIAVLLIAYMFYDLFIRDPMPPVRRSVDRAVISEDATGTDVISPAEEEVAEASSAPIPDDAVYLVKSGDTWSRIYSQYGVCSWFIRSHPSNEGKFDSDDNPVAGTRIYIPLLYSAKAEYNPDFYREFSLQKTGSRCENANQAFIDKFESENL